MKVSVRVFGKLVTVIGRKHVVELGEGATVLSLTNIIAKKAGSSRQGYLGEFRVGGGDLVVLVNGRNVALLDGLRTPLHDGDEVVILPPTAGG